MTIMIEVCTGEYLLNQFQVFGEIDEFVLRITFGNVEVVLPLATLI